MDLKIKENVLLAPYTVYKIGGPARYFAEIKNRAELMKAREFAGEKSVPVFILGAGSNVLASDKGFSGLIVRFAGGETQIKGERLAADAGVMMAQAVLKSAEAGLSGFEWGIGVPGTIGGSVRGNAGCFGGEMKDIAESVEVFDFFRNEIFRLPAADCGFGYRDSVFKRRPEWAIVSALVKLKKGEPRAAKEIIRRIAAERTEKQDIGSKSCGCIFKNVLWARKDVNKEKILGKFPELEIFRDKNAIPASFLIDRTGLKGRRTGAAFISPKHANFFVNGGGAKAEEIVMLIAVAKDAVRRKYGIILEEEIQYVGF